MKGGLPMNGDNFIFDGQQLTDYECVLYAPSDSQQFIGKNIEKSSDRAVSKFFKVQYSDTLKLSFLIGKDHCKHPKDEDFKLSGDDVHYLRSWLESPTMSELKVMQDDDDNLCTHYYGVFSDIQPYEIAGECYGLYLTFTCNAPYGFTDEYKYVCYPNSETTLMVSNLSAEKHSYYKPVITITSSSTFDSESLSIENANDNGNTMIISMPNGKSAITIDCEKEMVFDSDGNILPLSVIGVTSPIDDNYSFLSADAFMFYWLRLAPNVNKLTILPSTATTIFKVEITARYPVKSGGY